ncbi:MAG: AraC family transcriptional regulator [Verrucomicrobiota bacterium]
MGYHDYYHFSRRFKIVMGLSPQQYREHFGSAH